MKKVINNNFISSIDQNGNQVIIRGLGIGFQKKPGEWIKPDKVEAIYRIDDKVTSNKLSPSARAAYSAATSWEIA